MSTNKTQTLQFLTLHKLERELKTYVSAKLQRGTWTPSVHERPHTMRCTHYFACDNIIPSANYNSHVSHPATSFLVAPTYPHPMHIEAADKTEKLTSIS